MAGVGEMTAAEFLQVCCYRLSVWLPRSRGKMNERWEFRDGK